MSDKLRAVLKKVSKSDGLSRINDRAKQVDEILDFETKLDAGLADARALIAKLTPTQQSRALATVSGVTPCEIAKAKGVLKQSVSESIAAPAVRMMLHYLVSEMLVKEFEGDQIISEKNLADFALEAVANTLHADRVVTFGNTFVERPDLPTRLAAASRILGYYEAVPIATKPPVIEEVAIKETTRRATSRRSR